MMKGSQFVPEYQDKRPRIKRHTKRQLSRLALKAKREAREAMREEYRKQGARTRREDKLSAPFVGVDPERTLELIGE